MVIGAGRQDRRLGGRRRRQRPRPAAQRGAVDARQGLRHLVPVGPVDHDRRRAARRGRPAHRLMGQRRAAPGREHRPAHLRPAAARRLHLRDVHARAGRHHPHRHARRRRQAHRPAALPRARRRRADRDRAPGLDRARSLTRCSPDDAVDRGRSMSARRTALVLADDAVDEAVLGGLIGREEAVALHGAVDLLLGLPGVLRVDLVDALARLEDLAGRGSRCPSTGPRSRLTAGG